MPLASENAFYSDLQQSFDKHLESAIEGLERMYAAKGIAYDAHFPTPTRFVFGVVSVAHELYRRASRFVGRVVTEGTSNEKYIEELTDIALFALMGIAYLRMESEEDT